MSPANRSVAFSVTYGTHNRPLLVSFIVTGVQCVVYTGILLRKMHNSIHKSALCEGIRCFLYCTIILRTVTCLLPRKRSSLPIGSLRNTPIVSTRVRVPHVVPLRHSRSERYSAEYVRLFQNIKLHLSMLAIMPPLKSLKPLVFPILTLRLLRTNLLPLLRGICKAFATSQFYTPARVEHA